MPPTYTPALWVREKETTLCSELERSQENCSIFGDGKIRTSLSRVETASRLGWKKRASLFNA
jgi:hypothetical protein